MNFSVPGQGASLEPPLLRNVGGGTAVDEDVCIGDSSEHILCNNTGCKPTQKDYIACIFST